MNKEELKVELEKIGLVVKEEKLDLVMKLNR